MLTATSILEDSKYYGTIIRLSNGDQFSVWIRGENTRPSKRQAEQWGIKLIESAMEYCSDEHYETQSCFELCEKIVAGINQS